MTDAVAKTLSLWRSRPFIWGGCVPHKPGYGDCMLSIGEYMASVGGTDVTVRFRGTYGDQAGALATMRNAGGAINLVESVGWTSTKEPVRGDVAVISMKGLSPDGSEVLCGALCTGDAFAFRRPVGVIEIPLRFVRVAKAWRCPR